MIQTDKSRRAAEAERLLDEPLLNEAFEKIEKDALNEMLKLPFWADRKRRMLIDRINTIRGMKAFLKSTITTGKDEKLRVVA